MRTCFNGLYIFNKKTSTTCANKFAGSRIKNENISDQKLAQELLKPIVKKNSLTFFR